MKDFNKLFEKLGSKPISELKLSDFEGFNMEDVLELLGSAPFSIFQANCFKERPSIDSYVEYFTNVLKDLINAINNDDSFEIYSYIGQLMDIVKQAYGLELPNDYDKYLFSGQYIPTLAYLMDKAKEEIKKEK